MQVLVRDFLNQKVQFIHWTAATEKRFIRQRPACLTRLAGLVVMAVVLLAFGVARAASNGPASGGNTLTIPGTGLGNGSDITNVTICGVAAVIQSQTANSVTVLVGSGGNGIGDIRIYSANIGVATFVNSYSYNPPGYIAGPFLAWLSVCNLPAARYDLAAVSVNGNIYAIGGGNGSIAGFYYYSTVYVYDPSRPTLGWLNVSNLPATRAGLAAASVDGKIYAIGGYNGNAQSKVYAYDPSRPTLGWLNVSNLPAARSGLAAASVDGKIYAIGGNNAGGNAQSIVYVYDPSQPMLGWLSASNLPAPRLGSTAANVNGNIYAIGGYDGVIYQSTVYEGAFATAVTPSSGLLTGGNAVTISGNNLGKGDVTSVTLCSVPTIILSDNSPTQILVRAGAAAMPVTGDVIVNSTSYGVTAKSNAYTYLAPIIASMPAFDGKHLQLSWPTNCLGWELQAQTNPPGAGLGTNWFPVAGSTNNAQMSIPINPNNPSVFYRLHQR